MAGLSIVVNHCRYGSQASLASEAVIHSTKYQDYSYQAIEDYDQIMTAFGEARETMPWSENSPISTAVSLTKALISSKRSKIDQIKNFQAK